MKKTWGYGVKKRRKSRKICKESEGSKEKSPLSYYLPFTVGKKRRK